MSRMISASYAVDALTPVWTGGFDRQVDRLHETAIIGCFRWWYEVFVRGLGGRVHAPTADGCTFDLKKYQKSQSVDERNRLDDAGLCDVCQIFGATGWQRRFRLTIDENALSNAEIKERISADCSYKGKERPTWYFKGQPKEGKFTIKINSLFLDFSPEIVGGLIQFIADWAAIGAKTQMGFGVIKPANGRIETVPLYDQLLRIAGEKTYPTLPSLKNIFLSRIKVANLDEKQTFNLKCNLRQLFAGHKNKELRHYIMGTAGTAKGDPVAAKIKISRPYRDGEMTVLRIWGWVPESAEVYAGKWNRDEVVKSIYDYLKKDLIVWREMNSLRDTITPKNGDARSFLQTLLQLGEG